MSGFIAWLEKINTDGKKAKAVLRHSLAFEPGAWYKAFPYVEPFLIGEDNQWRRQMYYLVAGLWAAHWKEGRAGPMLPIGKACALLDKKRSPDQKVSSTERRFITMLDSDPDQLPHRLRQLLALLKDHPVDFENMLTDLFHWRNERKPTQNAWARDFYRSINTITEQTTQEK